MFMLILFAGTVVLELLVHSCSKWPRLRTTLTATTLVASGTATGALIVIKPGLYTFIFAALMLYRMFNLVRIAQKRMYEHYLRIATARTSAILAGMQLIVVGLAALWQHWQTASSNLWAALTVLQFAVALVFVLSVVRTMRRTAWPIQKNHYSDAELPSVTVAIPARNETEDLQQCLQSVIASNYPKLEIIVLDDCSQTKRTPEIIREFAHDGVRFIKGSEPSKTWLPKNQAYARLADEASGAYIIFCGVDMRFQPHTIRSMITTMLDRNKEMLSILPRRRPEYYGHFSLIQVMRYWWELVPPRRLFNRPPVLSSCWAITHKALKKTGGFDAIRRAIVPEAYFARELTKSDGYSFLRSDGLGLESTKSIANQRSTAIRMRYPQLHRRPENVAFLSLLELCFLVAPFMLAVAGFWVSLGTVAHVLAGSASVLLVASYVIVGNSTRVITPWFALISQPVAALADIVLVHYSMSKYEFSTVEWKGRNVCIPVMHVTPHLPKISGE